MNQKTFALWQIPPDDFPAWRELTGETIRNHAEYQELLATAETTLKKMERHSKRVNMTVIAMRMELLIRGLDNTAENRAKIVAEMAEEHASSRS